MPETQPSATPSPPLPASVGVFRLRYQRPASQPGRYINEASADLSSWQEAGVLREQPVNRFGSIQDVTVEIVDPSGMPGAPPQLFYRIRHVP